MALITHIDTEKDGFARIAGSLDEYGDLARPALALAADEFPGLNVRRYLDKLDDLADEALQSAVIGSKTECQAARRLAVFLSQAQQFRGNTGDYYDPNNSFLNCVIDQRVGIPITLSLVLIEVGRRLGLPLVGIGFPGHFLVGCGPHRRNEYLLLDPFCDGKVVEWEECELRLQAMGMQFNPETHLSPVTNRQFFARLIGNLKAIYIKQRDIERAMRAIARMTLLDEIHVDDYRQLGAVLANEGEFEGARRCLRAYLDTEPKGDDAESAVRLLSHLLEQRAQRN